MFLHFGIQHLINNMLLLLFLGDYLERAVGKDPLSGHLSGRRTRRKSVAAMQVVHNEADADDIAQETMVKLYLNIDALDEDRVEGWVRVAAKNLGIDYQRKSTTF